jgi:uncharacterized protein YfaS (alpha-2-macroglobulin family)
VGTGGFSYWPGVTWGYAWTTVYATHFLVEAKKAGYAVDEVILQRLLDHLVGLSNASNFPVYGAAPDHRSQIYALYVLALAGRPNVSTMSYASDLMKRTLDGKGVSGLYISTDEETRALLAGAFLLAGDKARASDFISRELQLAKVGRGDGFWSASRADAVILSVLADVAPDHRSVPALMKAIIDRATIGRWYNTQENAFALMALGKIGRAIGQGEYTGAISVGGQEVKAIDSKGVGATTGDESWVGKTIQVSVKGTAGAFVGVRFEGIPAGVEPARSNGMKVERTFHDRNGAALDAAKIRQGDLVYVRLTVSTAAGVRLENLALVELLPAGLEIENPRLNNAEVPDWMNKNRYTADYMDIRDDRLLLFVRYHGGGAQTYYYAARAVTEGEFVLPHFHAEAMYDPETQAREGGGRLAVKGRDQQ